jgi:tetraacyldisaccharide-1-P 4'-kinase
MFVVSERKVAESQEMLPPLDERLLKILPAGTSVYRAYFEAVGVRWLDSGEQLAPQNIGAFAAIANPETFFDSLVRLGFALSERQVFADHHPFSQQELSELFARNPGLPLVCTEKDAVKLSGMSAELRSRIAVLAVKLKVVPADAFVVQVQRKLLGGAAS